ncbi:MAG TPA: ornithine cyclodeaminase [Steroidobacteraceae bacterium]|nr:ornithine cyclodeaminase [Steroidobacteraceae bacterium]
MVSYIGTSRVRQLLSRLGPARFIESLALEIEADYRRWSEFDKSARHAIHSPGGVIELMPISDGRLYSFKYVNGHPQNTAAGLLTVTAFGVLSDVATGYPLLVSEMTFVTALRTAAISALAARHMARAGSRTMALIGNGAQSEFQAIAFHRMLGIRRLRLFDTDPDATAKLARNLEQLNLDGLDFRACASAAEAARGADIVTTATADKRNALILTPDMIEPGMHLNAVGGDCPGKTELHPDILKSPRARIVVEFEPQARIEGEIQQLGGSTSVIELADVLCANSPGRLDAHEVTLFDSVGFALNDFSALRYLHRLDLELAGARKIDLVPELDDPKNLYGALQPVARAAAAPAASAPARAGISVAVHEESPA